jgi:hypothetical protein
VRSRQRDAVRLVTLFVFGGLPRAHSHHHRAYIRGPFAYQTTPFSSRIPGTFPSQTSFPCPVGKLSYCPSQPSQPFLFTTLATSLPAPSAPPTLSPSSDLCLPNRDSASFSMPHPNSPVALAWMLPPSWLPCHPPTLGSSSF